jgi:co-chaperonin GroES (HSP10)
MYTDNKTEDTVLKAKLPVPVGYKILITIPEIDEKTEGGLIRPGSMVDAEEVASIIGFVMQVGESAYSDKDRFPGGPWCKEGDFVIFRSYSGTRFKVMGKEFRIINDDTVEAVVEDPRGYSRA